MSLQQMRTSARITGPSNARCCQRASRGFAVVKVASEYSTKRAFLYSRPILQMQARSS